MQYVADRQNLPTMNSFIFRRIWSQESKQSSVELTSCAWTTTRILSTIVTIATVHQSRTQPRLNSQTIYPA